MHFNRQKFGMKLILYVELFTNLLIIIKLLFIKPVSFVDMYEQI